MKIKKILKTIGKNFFAALTGAIIGAVISVLYGWNFWLPTQIDKLSSGFGVLFGAIGIMAVTVILFSILGIIIGGILGIILYQILKK